MAKKFVKVTGINKALSYNSATNTWSILSTVSADIADENSILYITANSSDAGSFG
jgi:antitoxin component of MazEF toxin-antitoxin module